MAYSSVRGFISLLDLHRELILIDLKEGSIKIIAEKLLEQKHITVFEKEDILRPTRVRNEKARTLINCIHKKDQPVYDAFLEALAEARENDIYTLLAGHPPITSLKLGEGDSDPFQEYQEALKEHLRRKTEILRKTQLKSRQFVRLRLSEHGSEPDTLLKTSVRDVHSFNKQRTDVLAEDLWRKVDESKTPRNVVISGGAGYGKTHLCAHIAEQAAKGYWKYPNTVPFFLCFRDFNNKDMLLSLKDFLISYNGPGKVSSDKHWEAIQENENRMWIIMDGFDELQFDAMADDVVMVTDPGKAVTMQQLIKSLIIGELLHRAKLLITTRPHKLEPIIQHADRVVECFGMDQKQVFQFMKEELHKDYIPKEVGEFLHEHSDILDLCHTPIHAVSLVKYLKYKEATNDELIPKTKTELSLFLIQSSLIELHKKPTNVRNALTQNSRHLEKIAKLCGSSFEGGFPQLLFKEEDLEQFALNEEDCKSGLLTLYYSISETMYGTETTKYFNIPHLANQEFMAAAYHTQLSLDEIKIMIRKNMGQLDSLLSSLVGLLGNKSCHDFLNTVFPHDGDVDYCQKAEDAMRILIASPRRFLPGGTMFALEVLRESKQWHLADDIQVLLGEDLVLRDHFLAPGECTSLTEYLYHLSHPHRCVWVAGKLCGQTDVIVGAANGCQALHHLSPLTPEEVRTITHVIQQAQTEEVGFESTPVILKDMCCVDFGCISSLQYVGLFQSYINRRNLSRLCNKISSLPNLEVLNLSGNTVGHGNRQDKSVLSCLKQLRSLKTIILESCNLGWRDVIELCKLSERCVEHVLICDNPCIGEGNIAAVCRQMDRQECQLITLDIGRCGLSKIDKLKIMKSVTNKPTMIAVAIDSVKLSDTKIGSSMKKLIIPGSHLSLQDVAQIKHHQCSAIDLKNSDIRDVWNELFGALVTPQTLTYLGLAYCNLRDENIRQLTEALQGRSSVNTINLKGNTDVSCSALAQLCIDGRLSTLNIAETELNETEWGVVCAAVSSSFSLHVIYIGNRHGHVDMSHGIRAFQRKLKHVYIMMSPVQHLLAAPALCKKESELEAPGMFVTYNNRDTLAVSEFCNHLPSIIWPGVL